MLLKVSLLIVCCLSFGCFWWVCLFGECKWFCLPLCICCCDVWVLVATLERWSVLEMGLAGAVESGVWEATFCELLSVGSIVDCGTSVEALWAMRWCGGGLVSRCLLEVPCGDILVGIL